MGRVGKGGEWKTVRLVSKNASLDGLSLVICKKNATGHNRNAMIDPHLYVE